MVGGDDPFYWKFWAKFTLSLKNCNFQLIFARSASPVILSEKKSPNRTQRCKVAIFGLKVSKKVCYKVSLM